MKQIQVTPDAIPRLPLIGWDTFGRPKTGVPRSLLQSRHIRYTTSGRAAIALALRELGVGPGDQVLIPTYHCPTMVSPAVFSGARPVFFPITPSGAAAVDSLADKEFPRVKALLAAHYFGIPQPMKRVREFCDRRGIALIEDCAHSIFGVSDGRRVGSWGDLAIASTQKFFVTPSGGCLVSATHPIESIVLSPNRRMSDLRELANMIEISAKFGRLVGLNRLASAIFAARNRHRGWIGSDAPRTLTVDPNAEVHAGDEAAGFDADLVFLEPTRITRWIVRATNQSRLVARRRENYRALASALAETPGTRILHPTLSDSTVPYVFPLWVDNPDDRYYGLKAAGIPVFRWDWLWAGTPALPGDYGRLWSRHIFQLPCHQDLTAADLKTLVARVNSVFAAMPGKPAETCEPARSRAGAR